MDSNLKRLFPLFVKSLADAELIDNIDFNGLQIFSEPKKADYFFDSRKIICEQKSLDNSMLKKFEKEINAIISSKRVRIYGRLSIDAILDRFKDSESLKQRVFNKLTKSIEGSFEAAHKQIKTTKEIFKLPHSKGILLILNETSYLFSPSILMRKVSGMFNKRTHAGNLRYREIVAAWIIQFSHYTELKSKTKAFPTIKLLNNIGYSESDFEYVANYLETLEKEFADFLRMPYLTKTIEGTNFEPNKMPSIQIY